MTDRPADLPDFDRPPVSEVVLGLQFGSLTELRSAHIGFLWAKFRGRYPTVTEHPPLDPSFETFGSVTTAEFPEIRLQQLLQLPFPRYWFENAIGDELCQVQQDRFVHNWRKRDKDLEYPRYETVRGRLVADLAVFEEFLSQEDLGSLTFNQVEVTYTNTIDLPDSDDPHGAIARVVSVWSDIGTPERELEDVNFRTRYIIKKDSVPHARLHVSVTPVLRRPTLAKAVQLQLTMRGKPDGVDRESALSFLDEGRSVIVKAFAELTTKTMHKHWGRRDV